MEISGLTCDYGGGKGVFDLSFTVNEGEVFGFLGPNGAGKTTTIRHLMGFSRPRQGKCAIGGMDCWTDAYKIQGRLGYLPGEIAFPEEMTGLEFLRFLADYRGLRDSGRTKELMERFDLDAGGRLRRMSKGMKQKVAIVAAFQHDPAVLVLDEPTSGLDPLMQNRFVELILEERARGKTILMSSHMFEEVERTCSRVGIIRKGRMAAVETAESLRQSRRKTYLVTLPGEAEAEAFEREVYAETSRDGCRIQAVVRGELGPFLQTLSCHPVVGLDVAKESLEEVFLHIYGGEAQ